MGFRIFADTLKLFGYKGSMPSADEREGFSGEAGPGGLAGLMAILLSFSGRASKGEF